MISSRYFSAKELACPCCGLCVVDAKSLHSLDMLRESVGQALIINSGCRCQKHNDELKGSAPKSFHVPRGLAKDQALAGSKAFDIRTSPLLRDKIIEKAPRFGFTGIGVGKDFVHLDTGHVKLTKWTYP